MLASLTNHEMCNPLMQSMLKMLQLHKFKILNSSKIEPHRKNLTSPVKNDYFIHLWKM